MTTAQDQSIAHAVTNDHNQFWATYDEYVKNAGNVDAQTRWSNQLTWEIARHAISEELAIYPLFEKHLGERGQKMADQDREEHQEVKEKLFDLDNMTPGSEEHAALLKVIIDRLKTHAHSEETHDLPALESALSGSQNMDAAKSFNTTKKFVPTRYRSLSGYVSGERWLKCPGLRPHPKAPNKPPFETLVGMLTAPVDKLRDSFRQYPSVEEVESITHAGPIN
ncbi:hypothetical protein D9756_006747 [Leucocoprinus leucothites]|uniref:Hemerythrin-like domain-containing protein n=1 Tax=Leucocoprinus leucothites TaxID=201217 RepID=A0A8H5G1X7_9AGAR|nr:hypothetical protein D9756_006747 [Leucoagaricus leucothites]